MSTELVPVEAGNGSETSESQATALVPSAPAGRPVPFEQDMMKLGQAMAQSGYFPNVQRASQAIVKMLAGKEMGFGPVASMQGVHLIDGKISLSGNLIAAAIKRSPRYTYRIREHTTTVCKIEFLEQGESIGISEFTLKDAEQAGVASKKTWQQYPRNMLFNRAISNGARWFCPDIFAGAVYVPEELGAEEEVGPDGATVVSALPAPVIEVDPSSVVRDDERPRATADTLICETCGAELGEIRFRDGTAWLPAELATMSRRKHGKPLCMAHYKEANEARRRTLMDEDAEAYPPPVEQPSPATRQGECSRCHHTATLNLNGTCANARECNKHMSAIKPAAVQEPDPPSDPTLAQYEAFYAEQRTAAEVRQTGVDFGPKDQAAQRAKAFSERCENDLTMPVHAITKLLKMPIKDYMQKPEHECPTLEVLYGYLARYVHERQGFPGVAAPAAVSDGVKVLSGDWQEVPD
jgi:hypothetical protein